jgi:hypothetical protein
MFPSIGCIGSREVPQTTSALLMEGHLRPYQYSQQVLLEVPVLTSDNLVDLHTRVLLSSNGSNKTTLRLKQISLSPLGRSLWPWRYDEHHSDGSMLATARSSSEIGFNSVE